MSAQPLTTTPSREAESGGRTPLRLLPTHRPTLSTVGFGLLITMLVVAGLAGVMVVSTSVSAQSRELAGLRKEHTELGYTVAALTTELQSRSSTGSLVLRATQLGMVPNTHPAFIRLSDGAILGDPQVVTGTEVTYLKGGPAPSSSAPGLPVIVMPEAAVGQPEAATDAAQEQEVAGE